MSWLRIDDAFTEHPKAATLTDEQLGFWVRCACWSQRNPQFQGFVPRALLPTICKRTMADAEGLAAALVGATAGGFFKFGLWEPVEGGWMFHDWEKYQPIEKLTREEAARLAGQKSAKARKERFGSAQPSQIPERFPNDSRTSPNDFFSFEERSTERLPNDVRPNDSRTSRTPDPDPDPDPDPGSKVLDVEPKDLTGSAREPGSDDGASAPPESIQGSTGTNEGTSPGQRVTGEPQSGVFDWTLAPPRDRDPTRPENPIPAPPSAKSTSRRKAEPKPPKPPKPKPEHFVPDGWEPNEGHHARAKELGVLLNLEMQKFKAHEFRVPKTDWDRAFTRWLTNASQFSSSSGFGVRRPSSDDSEVAEHTARFSRMLFRRTEEEKEGEPVKAQVVNERS
jgi:hypothetical protein